jgi:hypothetical protein
MDVELTGFDLKLIGDKREQRDVARPLDGFHHHSLMAGTGACDPARHDFAALGDEFRSKPAKDHLLVIYECCFIDAEHADFPTRFSKLTWFSARFAGRSVCHAKPHDLS